MIREVAILDIRPGRPFVGAGALGRVDLVELRLATHPRLTSTDQQDEGADLELLVKGPGPRRRLVGSASLPMGGRESGPR